MTHELAASLVRALYQFALHRAPDPQEEAHWVQLTVSGLPIEELIARLARSGVASSTEARPRFPPGHYYSPILDVEEALAGARNNRRRLSAPDLKRILDDAPRMWALVEGAGDLIRDAQYDDDPTPWFRFHYNNGGFPYGDALTLHAMVQTRKPHHIIEIGSGFSTACMLDALDQIEWTECAITCIEPYPDRLRSLLRPQDDRVVTLIADKVQNVPLETFDVLETGDILFIDSTHVLKTGSDVHWELFEILPRLPAGVLVHFHDLQFPFEYPDEWIEANYSWNKSYGLRAFLCENYSYRVLYWSSMLARLDGRRLAAVSPLLMKNPGASIWLEKVA